MKKVSFRIRNFDKEQFLTYNIDDNASLDEDVLDFLEDEEPKGIVPIIYEEDEEFDTFSYNITDKIRMCELSNQEINAEMVLKVMRGLVMSLVDMGEYRVPLSYLVLHRNYIYINSEYEVEFICVPLEEMQEDVDVNAFLRNFVASLRFESSENGDYVAKLLSYINNTAIFNLRNMITLIEELMDVMGVEIPEDSANEIYVDYQEVEEAEVFEAAESSEIIDEDEVIETEELVDSEEEESIEEFETTNQNEELELEDAEELEEVVESEEVAATEEVAGSEEVATEETVESEDVATEETVEPEEVATEEMVESEEVVTEEMVEPEEVVTEEMVESEEDTIEVENSSEDEDAQNIIENLKKKVEEEQQVAVEEMKKPAKKPSLKTKESGVVIEDDFDDFVAEMERAEKEAKHEETGLKIKKTIKVNRASVAKSNRDESKEQEVAENGAEEEVVSNSILNQTIAATSVLKATDIPKANPYLIRVNTEERIMITKQNFKVGKASMGVDYTVKGNSAVSRVHAVITSKDDIYYVKDNKSTNHTFVNGKILDEGESELLTHDCKIVLGDEEFIFKLR